MRKLALWSQAFAFGAYAALSFQPNQTYDIEEAKMMASLSAVTYCDSVELVESWKCDACRDSKTPMVQGKIRLVDGGDSHQMRILIAKLRDQNGCVLSFRGSDNVMNWISDFKTWDVYPSTFEDCDGCKVHDGFYHIWKNVKDLALKTLTEVGCPPQGKDNLLYVTGHSLGAALTHLAMFSLDAAGFQVAKTYSFEAPRVGNRAFSDAFTDRFDRRFPVFRLTHHKDPFVHLPPEAFGYVHVQTEVHYSSLDDARVCQKVEDPSCADQYWDIPSMLLFNSGDHCKTPLVPNGDICYCQYSDAVFV